MTDKSRLVVLVLAIVLDIVLVSAVLLYQAMTPPISGRAMPDTSQVGLGVIATIDPCGFVTADVLAGPGVDVRWVRPFTLRNCQAMVGKTGDRDHGVLVDVSVTDEFDLNQYRSAGLTFRDSGNVHRGTGGKVPSLTPGSSDASIDLVFQDNRNAVISKTYWVRTSFDPCVGQGDGIDLREVAARVGDNAAHAIATGTFRHLNYPTDSVASVDLCNSVTTATLETVLDVPGTRSVQSDRNNYRWTISSGQIHPTVGITVRLDVQRDQGKYPLEPNAVVYGRPTLVYSPDPGKVCVYATNVKIWNPWLGYRIIPDSPDHPDPSLVEIVEVSVGWPTDTAEASQACDSAARIAWEVWQSIP
ncbi:hypothetical protein [Nocardia sp. CDC160]|uniref:hypothetical protein n=1 Tax=Nocardia sp. CDC160 TaxID=3112166 RepID=UPI002DB64822|nr:hypothetical protein [Nocardia sp. CDC160]MEC3917483.1 hypothetical protein [Nocardia sp. CDC160]